MAVFNAKAWFRNQIKPYLTIIKAYSSGGGGGGSAVKTTIVNFTIAKNSQLFTVADAAVLLTSKVSATLNLRSDTFDNCGDDMDEVSIRCRADNGAIKLIVGHTDAKQKLFGSFSINYTIN